MAGERLARVSCLKDEGILKRTMVTTLVSLLRSVAKILGTRLRKRAVTNLVLDQSRFQRRLDSGSYSRNTIRPVRSILKT
jgi:hypothetical protein